jgi:hypothetical protein
MTTDQILEIAQQAPTLGFALLVWYELRLLRTEVMRILTLQLDSNKS